MPNYEGSWKRAQFFETPSAVQIANKELHSEEGQVPELGWKETHTAPTVATDPALEYIGDEFWQLGPDGGEPGVLIDQTPVDHSHRGDHSLNEGAFVAQNMRKDTDVKGPGETYREEHWKGFGPEAGSVSYTALIRGINSRPENNPPLAMYDGDGFRYGFWEFLFRGRDRKFLVKPLRTEHGARPVYPNTAAIPPESAYKQDVPLWANLASSISKRTKRPMMRISPPPLGDVYMEDGNETADDSLSIIGVF